MKYFAIIFSVVLLGGAAWYFVGPLFQTIEVNDEVPTSINVTAMPSGAEALSPAEQQALQEAMDEANTAPEEERTDAMPSVEQETTQTADVVGTVGHPAEGTVRVIETASGPVIRFENFRTINGPQLHLYLAKDLEATEYIDLGPIRGTQGNINYQVPADVDLSEYRYVMYWCVPFEVLFNYADIGSI